MMIRVFLAAAVVLPVLHRDLELSILVEEGSRRAKLLYLKAFELLLLYLESEQKQQQ